MRVLVLPNKPIVCLFVFLTFSLLSRVVGSYRQMRCIALRVLQSLKGFGFFCFVNRLSGGGGSVIQITMQRAHPAWSVKTKLKIA